MGYRFSLRQGGKGVVVSAADASVLGQWQGLFLRLFSWLWRCVFNYAIKKKKV